jgi:hypothetical protein
MKYDYTEILNKIQKVFNINTYTKEGFEKVCEVAPYYNSQWLYKNINRELLYANHRSWVYFIVENETIVKCGETGNPLGLLGTYCYDADEKDQPLRNTKSRFGRLRAGDSTDLYIRESLKESIEAGNIVSLWAKKCPIYTVKETVGGVETNIPVTSHKNLEMAYLDLFKQQGKQLPILNKATK